MLCSIQLKLECEKVYSSKYINVRHEIHISHFEAALLTLLTGKCSLVNFDYVSHNTCEHRPEIIVCIIQIVIYNETSAYIYH